MSVLEGARRDIFFSDLDPDELHELMNEEGPWLDLDNFKRKERTFDSPGEEIKWRTDKLLREVGELEQVKPAFKPPRLDEIKRRVEEAVRDNAHCGSEGERREVLERVRELGEEMREVQVRHKERVWALLEELDRGQQEDPEFLTKMGVPEMEACYEDEDDDDKLYRGFGFPDDEEDAIRREYEGYSD